MVKKEVVVVESIIGGIAFIVSLTVFIMLYYVAPYILIYMIVWPVMVIRDSAKAVVNVFRRK